MSILEVSISDELNLSAAAVAVLIALNLTNVRQLAMCDFAVLALATAHNDKLINEFELLLENNFLEFGMSADDLAEYEAKLLLIEELLDSCLTALTNVDPNLRDCLATLNQNTLDLGLRTDEKLH